MIEQPVIEHVAGLSDAQLSAVADLERRVLAADGGRLKLEWGTLRSRSGEQVEDLLCWDGPRLAGFVGRYAFGGSVELSGMVAPEARRRGVGTALLRAALRLCADRGQSRVLLVVPGPSAGGRALALAHGGALEHSEHALVLWGDAADGSTDPRLRVRPAQPADAAAVSGLLEAAFGHPDPAGRVSDPREQVLVAELDGELVATVRRTRDGDTAGVYGFAVDPARQGRGIGRDVLRRVCRQLRDDGARQIGLEVAVDNDRALGLYTCLEFTRVTTEDYYEVPTGGPAAG